MITKMIVVDDDKHIRNGIAGTIEWHMIGVKVIGAAADGVRAMEMIKKETPDIVLTDIMMPNMNGIELAKTLHQNYPGIKVIALSGYREFEYARRAMEYGVFKYILKPINESELVQTVYELRKLLIEEREREESSIISKQQHYHLIDIMLNSQLKDIMNINELESIFEVIDQNDHITDDNLKIISEMILQMFLKKSEELNMHELVSCIYSDAVLQLNNPEKTGEVSEIVIKAAQNILETLQKEKSTTRVVAKAKEYVESHVDIPLNTAEVAKVLHRNPDYFSHIFKKEVGVKFLDYLHRVKIEKAKEMLRETDKTIYCIASETGYETPRNFVKIFKKLEGTTPSVYRVMNK